MADSSLSQSLRIQVAMYYGGGNISLILPVVACLVARGHQVRVMVGPPRPGLPYTSPSLIKQIEQTGATPVPFEEPAGPILREAPPVKGLIRGWTPRRLSIDVARATRTISAASWATNIAAELGKSPADAILTDHFLYGPIVAAEASGTPVAVLVHNVPPPTVTELPPAGLGLAPTTTPFNQLSQWLWKRAQDRIRSRDGLPALNSARADLGLAPLVSLHDQYARANRLIVLVSKAFEFPTRRLPPNVRYCGSPIDDADLPPGTWESPWPNDDPRPLVLVSLSTRDQGQCPAMQRTLEAVADLPVRVLTTLGPSLNVEEFHAPPNTAIESFVPHSKVLPQVDAMITQCGTGTVAKALRHGVPLVCIPQVHDQPDNAARVVAHGAGVRLKPTSTAEEIRGAISRILAEPRFREGAQRLAKAMAGPRGEETAANEIELMVKERR